LLSSASILIALIFAALFYLVYILGFTVIGNIGVIMCLTSAFFDSLPISPMGGKDIYEWRKAIWVLLFVVSLALFAAAILYLGAM
jgi:hypothetical protein